MVSHAGGQVSARVNYLVALGINEIDRCYDREPSPARHPVQHRLHDRADVPVDLLDVGGVAEFGSDVDGLEHLGDDLGGQRHVERRENAEAERKTERDRQDVRSEELCARTWRAEAGAPATCPRVRNSWLSCPPMETAGTIGTSASIAVVM